MPLAKIHLRKGQSAEKKRAIADAIQTTLIEHLGIPAQDRFQLVTEYDDENFIHTDAFGDLIYTDELLILEVAFIEGRSDEVKKDLLAALNKRLVATANVRKDDVFVTFYDIGKANVSFGRGIAQRAL